MLLGFYAQRGRYLIDYAVGLGAYFIVIGVGYRMLHEYAFEVGQPETSCLRRGGVGELIRRDGYRRLAVNFEKYGVVHTARRA
jgi:hypothetical protein